MYQCSPLPCALKSLTFLRGALTPLTSLPSPCLIPLSLYPAFLSLPTLLPQRAIRCVKRFAARRGLPQKFLSDNSKTFKAVSRFLNSVFKEDTVRDYLADRECEWIFNIERAPWWGGAFEHMVHGKLRIFNPP